MSKGSGTRSGLLWEVERLLKNCDELPQVLLMENVPMIHNDENIDDFIEWKNFLMSLGYKNWDKDLNAKDYGIPQNRNRTFMVSILDRDYYNYPKPQKLEKSIKDFLEEKVDDKYYIDNEKSRKLLDSLIKVDDELSENIEVLGNIQDETDQTCQQGRVMNTNGMMACLGASGFGTEKYVLVKQNNKDGFIKCQTGGVADFSHPTSKTRRGRVQENGMVSPTLTVSGLGVHKIESPYRIRKLTSKEYWRLMGFSDDDYEKAAKVVSNTQLYKQAGNSIVVDVLERIFEEIFLPSVNYQLGQLSIFDIMV